MCSSICAHLSVSFYIIFLGIYVSHVCFWKESSAKSNELFYHAYWGQGYSDWTERYNIQKEPIFIATAASGFLLPSLKQSKCFLQDF